MDNDLKLHLEGMEARIMERVGDQIAGSEARMMERVDGRIDAAEQRLKAHTSQECEKVETKLLTEFHKWGRTSDMRTREAIRHADTLEERMLAPEDRISAIERKPAA